VPQGKYLYLSLMESISLQFRLTRQTASVVTSTIQKPFEILIFFSLDSNDGSAFFTRELTPSSGQCKLIDGVVAPSALDLHAGFKNFRQQVPERYK
jgi:hypothetical protein